ncbi:MAG TPA: ATP-binding cassette domain-containing protein, partial [Candidatus Avisuccinivibrio pullicola]|nr:ATP-binding cassette domain-containing protein [Candidatus Avisuccinivibrio pullicola]
MITLSSVTLMRGARFLLDGASATIFEKHKVGVIGRNGCGKSSLFAAITGALTPEKGTLSVPKDLRISSVAQQTPALDLPAIEYVIDGDKRLRELQRQRAQAEKQGDGTLIATLEEELGIAGAWTVRPRAEQLLHGLGFADEEFEHPVKDFSGGWRMRLNLAQALLCPSDLLLLDEP